MTITSIVAEIIRAVLLPIKVYRKHATLGNNRHQKGRRSWVEGPFRDAFAARAYANGASRAAKPTSKSKELALSDLLVAARATQTVKTTHVPMRARGSLAACHNSLNWPGTRAFAIAL